MSRDIWSLNEATDYFCLIFYLLFVWFLSLGATAMFHFCLPFFLEVCSLNKNQIGWSAQLFQTYILLLLKLRRPPHLLQLLQLLQILNHRMLKFQTLKVEVSIFNLSILSQCSICWVQNNQSHIEGHSGNTWPMIRKVR